MSPNNPFVRAVSSVSSLLDRIGFIWLWLVVSLFLLLIVALINPILLASYIWAASKITMAATIGFGVDLTVFRGADPRNLEGIEKSMAQTRRVTLLGCAMLAAGLIG